MSILGPLGSGWKQHIQKWTVETNKLSAALEKLFTFLGVFYLGGSYIHLFYYLDIVYNPCNVFCFFFKVKRVLRFSGRLFLR